MRGHHFSLPHLYIKNSSYQGLRQNLTAVGLDIQTAEPLHPQFLVCCHVSGPLSHTMGPGTFPVASVCLNSGFLQAQREELAAGAFLYPCPHMPWPSSWSCFHPLYQDWPLPGMTDSRIPREMKPHPNTINVNQRPGGVQTLSPKNMMPDTLII